MPDGQDSWSFFDRLLSEARVVTTPGSGFGPSGEGFIRVTAFGDAAVDIPMLEYCAVGVAMGNGSEDIKKIADLVTGDVEEDGLFQAFEKLELI